VLKNISKINLGLLINLKHFFIFGVYTKPQLIRRLYSKCKTHPHTWTIFFV